MGAVANAAMLLGDTQWRNLITAASLYRAREILSAAMPAEPTALDLKRRELARQTLAAPATTVQYMVALVATLPAVAQAAATVSAVSETVILDSVANLWDALADELIRLPDPV